MNTYPHPWIDWEDQDVSPKLDTGTCPLCWEKRSLSGTCWCSDYGPGKYTLKAEQ